MEEHLGTLSVKVHFKHHEVREFRSDWRVTESLKKAIQQINLVSSAKRYAEEAVLLGISVIQTRKVAAQGYYPEEHRN